MNKNYAEETLKRPATGKEINTDEDEVRLMKYLEEIGDGTRWIYTESHRICEAAALALNLLRAKNRALVIAKSAKAANVDRIRKQAYLDGYKDGYDIGMKTGVARAERQAEA